MKSFVLLRLAKGQKHKEEKKTENDLNDFDASG